MKWITWITTYTLIILAELGDKTQIATLLLASNNPRKKWVVFLGGALALTACVMLEVTVGVTLARFISQETINRATGAVFLLIGAVTLFRQYGKEKGWRMFLGILPFGSREKHHINSEKA